MKAIADLTAGRELDAVIAERVMGWTRRNYWCGGDELSDLFPPPGQGSFDDHGYFPEFSTDIAAAWTIVEHLHAQGLHVCVGHAQGDVPGFPNVFAHFRSRRIYAEQANAETAPLAICMAALMAVEATAAEKRSATKAAT